MENIEANYLVNNIKWRGKSLWPLYKPHLYSHIEFDKKEKTINTVSKFIYIDFFISFFKYFHILFRLKNKDFWIISSTKSRVLIDNVWQLGTSGKVYDYYGKKALLIESNVAGPHKKHHNTPNFLSEGLLVFVQLILYFFFKITKPKFEGEAIFIEINKSIKNNYDYKSRFYRFLAQYYAMKMLLKIKTPKIVYIVCYYTYTGYIFAFKEKKVKIVELQHGVINVNHWAYNFNKTHNINYILPDYLFTYGRQEKEILKNSNSHFIEDKNIFPVGSNIIDIYSSKTLNSIANLGKTFKHKIVISGQDPFEKEILSFIKEIAPKNPELFFIYVPRTKNRPTEYYGLNNLNVYVCEDVNLYELMKHSSLHITIYSTACLESLALGTPTLFYNYDNLSFKHFGYLMDEYGISFCNSYLEFKNCFNDIIICNNKDKLKEVVSKQYANNHNKKIIDTLKLLENK